MLFSGNDYRLTPETNRIGFDLSGIYIQGTGRAEFGFSGSGNILKFQFVNNRIISPDSKFVGVYTDGVPFSLKGSIDTGSYQYYLNDDLVANRKTKTNYNIQRFFVNATGATLLSDVKLNCPDIPYTITMGSKYVALSTLTGSISNASDINFKVFNSEISYFQSNTDLLSGVVSGVVAGGSNLGISFSDLNTSRFDSSIKFLLGLDSSIGKLSGTFEADRVSGRDGTIIALTSFSTSETLSGLFDGSGVIGNRFIFTPTPRSQLFSYYVTSTNLKGEAREKEILVKLANLSHNGGADYRADYVTGFNVVTGGEYLIPPVARFTGYYYVSDLAWNINTLLFSSGCTGNIPVTFSGNGNFGRNASGTLLTKKIFLNNVYQTGVRVYYTPYSFQILSGGTGYLETPIAKLNTGLYGTGCYDVAKFFGASSYIYSPFNGSGALEPLAAYLTGEVLTRTGIVGGSQTGYIVTGLEFTNIGSGFTSGLYIPKMHFERRAGDGLTKNATGTFSLKTVGTYDSENFWSLKTGVSSRDLKHMATAFDEIILGPSENYFHIQVNYSGIDNTEPVVAKVSAILDGGNSIHYGVTGIKAYDITTGFLKKKDSLTLTTIQASEDLSFLFTRDELDTYYSSSAYLNNSFSVEIGDLDF